MPQGIQTQHPFSLNWPTMKAGTKKEPEGVGETELQNSPKEMVFPNSRSHKQSNTFLYSSLEFGMQGAQSQTTRCKPKHLEVVFTQGE